jgi:protein gp37
MAEHSPIGWTDATWPIIAGCDYVSPGCSNCWAVRDSWRLAHNPNPKVHRAYFGTVDKQERGKLVWSGIVRTLPERLDWPLKWNKPRRIFVCSQADLWNPKVPFEFIAAAFGIGAMAPQHTLQFLTKHAARMREFFRWLDQQQGGALATCLWHARQAIGPELASRFDPFPDKLPAWPLENAWLGVTVEDRQRAKERIPHLLSTPAAKRWLSVEPQLEHIYLGAVTMPAADVLANTGGLEDMEGAKEIAERGFDVHFYDLGGIDWVVCGGESAQTRANTRPFDLEWARSLKAECASAMPPIAFFVKQLGTNPRMVAKLPAGKTARYKWHEPQHWPLDLQVQQFPPE